jgi:hypothetical protein
MRFSLDERLIREAATFRLRSACRDCSFFAPSASRCIHGWPNGDQRLDVAEAAASADTEAAVEFCKEFELA